MSNVLIVLDKHCDRYFLNRFVSFVMVVDDKWLFDNNLKYWHAKFAHFKFLLSYDSSLVSFFFHLIFTSSIQSYIISLKFFVCMYCSI